MASINESLGPLGPQGDGEATEATVERLDLARFEGHTPGPWVFDKSTDAIDDSHGSMICDLYGMHRDGLLITAAPTLLSELKTARAEVERLRGVIHYAAHRIALSPLADDIALRDQIRAGLNPNYVATTADGGEAGK